MILLDTNVLSELVRPTPDPTVLGWAAGVPRAGIATTAITEAEMRHGLARLPPGQRRQALEQAVERLFAELLAGRVLPFDRAAARHYAGFTTARLAQGRPVAMADAMIVATALAHGAAAIAKRNTADFEGCGLPRINPWTGA